MSRTMPGDSCGKSSLSLKPGAPSNFDMLEPHPPSLTHWPWGPAQGKRIPHHSMDGSAVNTGERRYRPGVRPKLRQFACRAQSRDTASCDTDHIRRMAGHTESSPGSAPERTLIGTLGLVDCESRQCPFRTSRVQNRHVDLQINGGLKLQGGRKVCGGEGWGLRSSSQTLIPATVLQLLCCHPSTQPTSTHIDNTNINRGRNLVSGPSKVRKAMEVRGLVESRVSPYVYNPLPARRPREPLRIEAGNHLECAGHGENAIVPLPLRREPEHANAVHLMHHLGHSDDLVASWERQGQEEVRASASRKSMASSRGRGPRPARRASGREVIFNSTVNAGDHFLGRKMRKGILLMHLMSSLKH